MIQPGRGTDWHTPSMLQALLAGVVLALNPVFAAILIFIQLNNPSWMSASVKPYALSSMAVILLTLAICAAPSLFHSLRRVAGHPALKSDGARDFLLASLSLILVPLALGLRLITEPPGLAGGVIQPLAVILAAVPPFLWITAILRRSQPVPSPQRHWATVTFSLFLTTPLVILVETLALVLLIVLFSVWIASQPELLGQLQDLAPKLQAAASNPAEMARLMEPWLTSPLVVSGLLLSLSVAAPLLEELLKPAALWFQRDRRITPQMGFILGGVCGASFALIETLFGLNTTLSQPAWPGLIIGRIGTALLHTTASAVVGRALVQFSDPGRWGRLLAAWLMAALLHAVWNTLSLAGALINLRSSGTIGWLAWLTTSGLVALAAGCLVYLITQTQAWRLNDQRIY